MDQPNPYRHLVAAEVRAEMARKQVSATALCDATGIPNATLSRRLNGVHAFDVDELALIADHLGVTVTRFLPPHLAEQVSA